MDAKTFDDLVARIFRGASRRDTVRGVLAGAVAAAGAPVLAEAKNSKGKNRNDTHRKGTAHDEGKDHKGKRQVSAEAKKNYCLCKGTSQDQCTPTTCIDCTFQAQLGRKARKRIRKQFPFSFVVQDASECPGSSPTTTTTTPAPTTTTSTTTSTTPSPPPPPPTTTTTTSTTTSATSTTTTTTTRAPNICDGGNFCTSPYGGCGGDNPDCACAQKLDTGAGVCATGDGLFCETCASDADCGGGKACIYAPCCPAPRSSCVALCPTGAVTSAARGSGKQHRRRKGRKVIETTTGAKRAVRP